MHDRARHVKTASLSQEAFGGAEELENALRDPALRQRARREIERELDWRMLRRDARTTRAMLDFRSAARNEGLSPEQRRERLEREDMPEDVRAALCDEHISCRFMNLSKSSQITQISTDDFMILYLCKLE